MGNEINKGSKFVDETTKSILDALEKIDKKINSSSVLNGGFDKLVVDISYIRENQSKTDESLSKINDAIYLPDSGLFSKIEKLELKHEAACANLHELTALHKAESDTQEKEIKKEIELTSRVDSLVQWKESIIKWKWLVITTILGGIVKVVADLLFK